MGSVSKKKKKKILDNSFVLSSTRRQWKDGYLWTRNKALPRHSTRWQHLDLGFLNHQNCKRQIGIVCKCHSFCYSNPNSLGHKHLLGEVLRVQWSKSCRSHDWHMQTLLSAIDIGSTILTVTLIWCYIIKLNRCIPLFWWWIYMVFPIFKCKL